MSPVVPHVVYLHGFASSPASSKAAFFRDRLAEHGITLHCPDLNQPDFSTLTTTRMLAQVTAVITVLPPGPVVLIGSSLGAFVALHLAERAPAPATHPVDRLVLMAPALDFGRRAVADLGVEGMTRWRRTGWWALVHHADGVRRRVHYELYRDAGRYDAAAARQVVPTLVFQGRHDPVVDPRMVADWAGPRPHVTLVLLEDDHQLGASLARLWSETARFLRLGG